MRKRQRRLTGVDRIVVSLYARGLEDEKDILRLWAGAGGEGFEVLDERAHRPAQPPLPLRQTDTLDTVSVADGHNLAHGVRSVIQAARSRLAGEI